MKRSLAAGVRLALLAQAASGSRLRPPAAARRPGDDGSRAPGLAGAGALHINAARSYGESSCPCVGIDGIKGKTTTHFHDEYPADLGARCEAWDQGSRSCAEGGSNITWCGESWCYVDPCSCDLPVLPKLSSYLPGAEFKGRPVHYSYFTCGSKDTWSTTQKTASDIDAVCGKEPEEAAWGREECRCIGIAGQPGSTDVKIGNATVAYVADAGAKCGAWDSERHPECRGDGAKPDWCGKSWCYVDPCACRLATTPKPSSYLPGATFQGRPIYYSYATCGSTDTWAKEPQSPRPSPCKPLKVPFSYGSQQPDYNGSGYEKDWGTEWVDGEHPGTPGKRRWERYRDAEAA